MANYQYTSDILDDVLFRSGERTDGASDFEAAALRYINRAYQAVWMGGTEFDPTINDIWWWLKREGVIRFYGAETLGTATCTRDGTVLTTSVAPDLLDIDISTSTNIGWYIRLNNENTTYKISSYDPSGAPTTINIVGTTGDDGFKNTYTSVDYQLLRIDYPLESAAIKIIDPMFSPVSATPITATSARDIGSIHHIGSGTPTKFAMLDETTVRFNKWFLELADEDTVKIQYNYLIRPDALTDSASEEPLIPLEYRRLLSDIALFWIFLDKNDDRANGVGKSAQALLKAMSRENRSRWANWEDYATIRPRRPGGKENEVLRTESGMIIG